MVSTTTDGFITDHDSLSTFTTADYHKLNLTFTGQFAEYRELLGFSPKALEEKFRDPVGIISIKTRGQLGLGSKLSALTGLDNKDNYSPENLKAMLIQKISEPEVKKSFVYSANRLTGAMDVLKKGGHVTSIPIEKTYRVSFDNKREVLDNPKLSALGVYYETIPYKFVSEIAFVRGLERVHGSKYTEKHP